ncbi:MAG: PQQ-like beta-propeller repeat protein [Planctomycetales bacterium]|nr:PQQ-like beta-propeller repeat protein [Planctomycetales bacterium]
MLRFVRSGSAANLGLEALAVAVLGGVVFGGAVFGGAVGHAWAGDWMRFRGPDGTGVAPQASLPLTWSETENLAWRTELPGAGASSPIIVGNRVFVTCYLGPVRDDAAADAAENPSTASGVTRQLVCVDRSRGDILWSRTVEAAPPEDEYEGFITEHGFASNTPTSDGERVYVFYGKAGVLAYDLDGNELWRVGVGTESSSRRWGSAASLLLVDDLVIVNAAEESQSVRGLDKRTGEEIWKSDAASLELAYSTPALVNAGGRRELVVLVPGEVWGMAPETGKLVWFAETGVGGTVCPSPVVNDDVVYLFGGRRPAASLAVRCGGEGDVTDMNVLWSTANSSYVATPIYHEGHLYWIDDRGTAFCISAESGEVVYRERVPQLGSGGRPVYASPVLANGRLIVPSRWEGVFVLPAGPKFEVLAQNHFASDPSDFNATPAVGGDDMMIRSDRYLYCVRKQP